MKSLTNIIFLIIIFTLTYQIHASENKTLIKFKLVNLKYMSPAIKFDIRYATENNITGKKIYEKPHALLHEDAARALKRVNQKLKQKGFLLIVFDAFRPNYAQKLLWESSPPVIKSFFNNPHTGSNHTRGIAVDVSLFDLNKNKPATMPSEYDEFTERASIYYYGGTIASRKLRALLIECMESEGFKVNTKEWWHFELGNDEPYPLITLTFKDLIN